MNEITSSYEAMFGAIAEHQANQVEDFACESCGGEIEHYETDAAGNRFEQCKSCKVLSRIIY